MGKLHERRARARRNAQKTSALEVESTGGAATLANTYNGTAPAIAQEAADNLPDNMRLELQVTQGRFIPPVGVYAHRIHPRRSILAAAKWEFCTDDQAKPSRYIRAVVRGPLDSELSLGPQDRLKDVAVSDKLPFGAAIDISARYSTSISDRCAAYGAVMLFTALETDSTAATISGLDPRVMLVNTSQENDWFGYTYEAPDNGGGLAIVRRSNVHNVKGVSIVEYVACYAPDEQTAKEYSNELAWYGLPETVEHPSMVTTIAPSNEHRQRAVCSAIASMTFMLAK